VTWFTWRSLWVPTSIQSKRWWLWGALLQKVADSKCFRLASLVALTTVAAEMLSADIQGQVAQVFLKFSSRDGTTHTVVLGKRHFSRKIQTNGCTCFKQRQDSERWAVDLGGQAAHRVDLIWWLLHPPLVQVFLAQTRPCVQALHSNHVQHGRFKSMSREIFGHNQSRSKWFQVQPVTCLTSFVFSSFFGDIFHRFL
jgi:hypothetical protein